MQVDVAVLQKEILDYWTAYYVNRHQSQPAHRTYSLRTIQNCVESPISSHPNVKSGRGSACFVTGLTQIVGPSIRIVAGWRDVTGEVGGGTYIRNIIINRLTSVSPCLRECMETLVGRFPHNHHRQHSCAAVLKPTGVIVLQCTT